MWIIQKSCRNRKHPVFCHPARCMESCEKKSHILGSVFLHWNRKLRYADVCLIDREGGGGGWFKWFMHNPSLHVLGSACASILSEYILIICTNLAAVRVTSHFLNESHMLKNSKWKESIINLNLYWIRIKICLYMYCSYNSNVIWKFTYSHLIAPKFG